MSNNMFKGYPVKFCFIMRGIPGSFKSTIGEFIASKGGYLETSIVDNAFYYSDPETKEVISARHNTDQYHMVNGEYKFSMMNVGKFHSRNYKAFRKSCEDGIPIVVCDNTNTTTKEFKKYADTARHQGYIVYTCLMDVPSLETFFSRNTHDVPMETINKVRKRLLDSIK